MTPEEVRDDRTGLDEPTVVHDQAEIEGAIETAGRVIVGQDVEIQGRVRARSLTVAAGSRLTGGLRCSGPVLLGDDVVFEDLAAEGGLYAPPSGVPCGADRAERLLARHDGGDRVQRRLEEE